MNILDAFYSTVHSAPGGCEAVAVRMGIQPGVLRNKACPTNLTNKPTFAEVDQIMSLLGDYRCLHTLAANHGYVCVQVNEDVEPSNMTVLELVTQGMSAHGDLGASIHAAFADGRIDERELREIRQKAFDMHRVIEQTCAHIEALAAGK